MQGFDMTSRVKIKEASLRNQEVTELQETIIKKTLNFF
jgi:hypothetical protein